MEVNMPKEGILERSVARGELSVLSQEFLLKPEFVELVEKAKDLELNEYERGGVVRVLDREIRISKSFPPEFLREMSEVTSQATKAWEEAKKSDDFSKFEPWLDRIIDLAKRAADYLATRTSRTTPSLTCSRKVRPPKTSRGCSRGGWRRS